MGPPQMTGNSNCLELLPKNADTLLAQLLRGEPPALKPSLLENSPITQGARGICKQGKGIRGFPYRGKEKSYTIPLVNEQLPHLYIFVETGGKLYMMVGFLNSPGKVNYSL